jgi:hypothetical protein
MSRFLRTVCLALVFSASAAAQVTFTVTATANGAGYAYGYNSGQTYQFVFAVNPSFSNLASSTFGAAQNHWSSTNVGMDLWSDVSGSGLGGTYVSPSGFNNANSIDTYDGGVSGNEIQIQAWGAGGGLGITTLTSNDVRISFHIRETYLSTDLPNFTYPQTGVSPSLYFSNLAGTYNNGGPGWDFAQFGEGAHLSLQNDSQTFTYMDFTVKSLAITAVPEPSTYAAVAGVLCLGLAVWRRQQRR